jgi:hypothetical protein
VAPWIAVCISILSSGFGGASYSQHGWAAVVFDVISVVCVTLVVLLGQSALNGYWRGLISQGRIVPSRTRPIEWISLVVGLIWWALVTVYVLE